MDEEERREKVYSALSYVLFFAFVLFPLWWKTTEVYRADLPYDEIHNLSKITFDLSIFVDLVWVDLSAKSSIERIRARLEEEYNSTRISDKLLLTYKYNARKIDNDELDKFFGDGNSSNLFSVESASADLLGSVRVIFVSDKIAQLFGDQVDLFLGCHQQATLFVRVQLAEEEILKKLTHTLRGVLFNEQRLKWIVAKAFHRSVEQDDNLGKFPTLTVVNPLRNEYALELFIVEPTPSGPVHGDTNAELEMPLLNTFLSRLSLVTKVSMNSQVLYGIDFPVLPERDPRGTYFYYDSSRLPYLINPMESFMGSYVTTLPVIHLLVYLTPDVHRPLYIMDPSGMQSLYNSFVVAGWGGVTVVNTPIEVEDTSKLSLSYKLNTTDNQLALIALLRQYLGIDDSTTTASPGPGQDWLRLKRRQAALCPWQLQTLALQTWVDSTLDALVTVGSLLRLLERISNIVIDDHVADSIAKGVAQLSASVEASGRRGRDGLAEAVASSCRAAGAFEAAFFDHSLLSLLYFPDDQKYAIYTPLFLPLSLPVLVSVRQILSHYCRSYVSVGGKVEKE